MNKLAEEILEGFGCLSDESVIKAMKEYHERKMQTMRGNVSDLRNNMAQLSRQFPETHTFQGAEMVLAEVQRILNKGQ